MIKVLRNLAALAFARHPSPFLAARERVQLQGAPIPRFQTIPNFSGTDLFPCCLFPSTQPPPHFKFAPWAITRTTRA